MSDDGYTKEEIQAEIREAARILREDGVMTHLRGISEKLAKAFPDGNDDNGNNPDGGSEGKPPPKTDPKDSTDQNAKKRSRWWGDQL
jgi:hypothetical protein